MSRFLNSPAGIVISGIVALVIAFGVGAGIEVLKAMIWKAVLNG